MLTNQGSSSEAPLQTSELSISYPMTNIIPEVNTIETEIIKSFTVTKQKRTLIPEAIHEYSSHYWIYLALLIRGKDPEKYGFEKKKILKEKCRKSYIYRSH